MSSGAADGWQKQDTFKSPLPAEVSTSWVLGPHGLHSRSSHTRSEDEATIVDGQEEEKRCALCSASLVLG